MDLAERGGRPRAPACDFGEGAVGEHDIRRNLLLASDRGAERFERGEEDLVTKRERLILGTRLARIGRRALVRRLRFTLPEGGVEEPPCLSALCPALDIDVETETIVAARAAVARGLVTEVAQHERPTAGVRVRVLLHGVELAEIHAATAIDLRPVDGEGA